MSGKRPEEISAMVSKVMGEIFRDSSPEKMRAMMESMMPAMMEQCFASMKGESIGPMMHEMMPKMMNTCFSRMDAQQRQDMLTMCRDMLAQIEKKYSSPKD
ncbi:MAG: hypothetical protein HY676_00620 [Chloroflexi bacterium]|nr:hypothetical protein [Chloroflexota bacterium]